MERSVYPMEFITPSTSITENVNDSILLTTIEYLLSLNWPICPKPPPIIDIGTSMENFLRNVLNKTKLSASKKDNDMCKFEETSKKTIDYNEFLKMLQTALNQNQQPAPPLPSTPPTTTSS